MSVEMYRQRLSVEQKDSKKIILKQSLSDLKGPKGKQKLTIFKRSEWDYMVHIGAPSTPMCHDVQTMNQTMHQTSNRTMNCKNELNHEPNKPYDKVLRAAQLIKRVKACKSL